ncbi:hypothetical protein RJT34_21735 [Clitoria ternatea]|uniref:Uncharacterized protein n=1 Tax=Clitoria ternatea TaxID=43366 RepID=A0AAN9IUJ1_CLITE
MRHNSPISKQRECLSKLQASCLTPYGQFDFEDEIEAKCYVELCAHPSKVDQIPPFSDGHIEGNVYDKCGGMFATKVYAML